MGAYTPHQVPDFFSRMLLDLREAALRSPLELNEIPAPSQLTPFSVALTGQLVGDIELAQEFANGKFVLLYDPEGQQIWQGTTRIVIMAEARLDPEMANDPLLTEVAWSWLTESIAECDISAHMLSGTVTRLSSQSFGSIDEEHPSGEIELRASWTAEDEFAGKHLRAWVALMQKIAGQEPLPDGVASLISQRRSRD